MAKYGSHLMPYVLIGVDDEFMEAIKNIQAEVYNDIFTICRKNRGKVAGITFWSPYDRDNYLTNKLKKKNYPYLFDRNMEPKQAFNRAVNF
jgi:endo-1,4-beta-xylanase